MQMKKEARRKNHRSYATKKNAMELVNFPVHVFAAGCFLYSGDEEQRQAWFPAKRNERIARIARIANKMLAACV